MKVWGILLTPYSFVDFICLDYDKEIKSQTWSACVTLSDTSQFAGSCVWLPHVQTYDSFNSVFIHKCNTKIWHCSLEILFGDLSDNSVPGNWPFCQTPHSRGKNSIQWSLHDSHKLMTMMVLQADKLILLECSASNSVHI